MKSTHENDELYRYLRTDWGTDLLPALPLVSSHIESTTILAILRRSAAAFMPAVQEVLHSPVCLIGFGSLGRLEYVLGSSDLDPIILVRGKCSPTRAAAAREAVLIPLLKANPWLDMDYRESVLHKKWVDIAEPQIPFPVVGTDTLTTSTDDLVSQRRWQILLEGRCIFNDGLFNVTYDALLPHVSLATSLLEDASTSATHVPDFRELCSAGLGFYGKFDNPLFLYKSPFKYFKTRFLRDFFVFGTQLNFLLGWYLLRAGELLPARYIRAATLTKIARAVRFAAELDRECLENAGLATHCEADIQEALDRYTVQRKPLLLFGTHYETVPARLLHGLLMSVLARFVMCWEQIYDPSVREALASVPRNLNFESKFPQEVPGNQAQQVLQELQERRASYRRYMAATAEVLIELFPRGRVWSKGTVPTWVAKAVEPFVKS